MISKENKQILENEKNKYNLLKQENNELLSKIKIIERNKVELQYYLDNLKDKYLILKEKIRKYENSKNEYYDDADNEILNQVLKESLKNNPEYNDNLTYEELTDLQEKIGFVSKGITKNELNKITKKKIGNTKSSCVICLEDIKPYAQVYNIKCNHIFHIQCLESWLKDEFNCPICKVSIK